MRESPDVKLSQPKSILEEFNMKSQVVLSFCKAEITDIK